METFLRPGSEQIDHKKIVFVTGTRADFGKQKALIKSIEQNQKFNYYIFATGMHTLSRYGYTVNEIVKGGYRNIYTFINQQGNTPMDMMLSNTVLGLSNYIHEVRPDLIVVHGDRGEALAGSIVGAFNNILVAHIEGGERSGTLDELIRHAITKLSHIHFVSNQESKKRLMQMGESENAIFVIGSPDIDVMLSPELPTKKQVCERYDIKFDEYAILIFHPVVTELDDLRTKIESLVEAVTESGLSYVVINPNNDTGTERIVDTFNRTLQDNERFKSFPSMRFEYFLSLLKHSQFIIGNSSAGIREAPVYGVPTINVGSRQMNRFSAESILNVSEDKQEILAAVRQVVGRRYPTNHHFGDGRSADRFAEELLKSSLWEIPKQKQFNDIL